MPLFRTGWNNGDFLSKMIRYLQMKRCDRMINQKGNMEDRKKVHHQKKIQRKTQNDLGMNPTYLAIGEKTK